MRHRGWLGLVVVCGLALPAQAQVAIDWKFQQGDTFFLETENKNNQTMKVAGQAIPSDTDTTDVHKFEVVSASADSVVLKRTVVAVKIKSQSPAADELEKMHQRVIGMSINLTLDPRARKVTKVEGVDEYVKKLIGDNPLLKMMVGNNITEDTVKDEMEQWLVAFLPGKEVSRGEKWRRKSVMSFGPFGSLAADTE
jgi:hypothetical protein